MGIKGIKLSITPRELAIHFPLLAWWQFLLIFCTVTMFRFFELALEKTISAGKWYKNGLVVLFSWYWTVIAFAWTSVLDIEIFPLTEHPIFFLIGVSIALFLGAVYLLENRLDIEE